MHCRRPTCRNTLHHQRPQHNHENSRQQHRKLQAAKKTPRPCKYRRMAYNPALKAQPPRPRPMTTSKGNRPPQRFARNVSCYHNFRANIGFVNDTKKCTAAFLLHSHRSMHFITICSECFRNKVGRNPEVPATEKNHVPHNSNYVGRDLKYLKDNFS